LVKEKEHTPAPLKRGMRKVSLYYYHFSKKTLYKKRRAAFILLALKLTSKAIPQKLWHNNK